MLLRCGVHKKAVDLFPCAYDMLEDAAWLDMLRAFSYFCKFGNMVCKRSLASVRKASDNFRFDVERVCPAGMLTQLTRVQKSLGRSTCTITGGHLIQDGVPLKCVKLTKFRQAPKPFVHWMKEQQLRCCNL